MAIIAITLAEPACTRSVATTSRAATTNTPNAPAGSTFSNAPKTSSTPTPSTQKRPVSTAASVPR